MITEKPAYKSLRKMLEELESGVRFTKRLKGRCFSEAVFDDLENLVPIQGGSSNLRVHHVATDNVVKMPFTRRYPLAIAASVSLLIVAVYFSIRLFLPNQVQTGIGEYKVVELPDHSKITLNAASSISYNPISWYWNRQVMMEGEAFFEVEKGSDFVVNTSRGTVSVLGTSFNILDRAENFEVSCKTGKVSVRTAKDEVFLLADEKVKINELNGKLVKSSPEHINVATWKEGYFHFDAENLNNVLREFERQYGVNIHLNKDEELLFTGYFEIKDLNNSLETVCSAFGLTYRQTEARDTIIIE
jgi:ferric-dicitrate binding protein FerR (iron transport regulator)